MTNQFKNPIFWGLIAVLGGLGLLVWGYLKNESTIPDAYKGSGTLMVIGGIVAAAGFASWFLNSNRKR